MTIWESASFTSQSVLTGRAQQQMTADSLLLAYPPDYARYLVDVTVTILKSLERDLVLRGGNIGRSWSAAEMASYIAVVFKNSKVSYSVSLTALLYLLRFRHTLRTSMLERTKSDCRNNCTSSLPVIFVTSLVLANKFLHDRHISNLAWSTHSGIVTADINKGEIAFLDVIQHRLSVDQAAFQKWIAVLFNPVSLQNYLISPQPKSVVKEYHAARQNYAYALPLINYHCNSRAEVTNGVNFTTT